MLWKTEWNAIAARIRGLESVARLYLTSRVNTSADPFGIGVRQLLPHAIGIFETLENFLASRKCTLPDAAFNSLDQFVTSHKAKKLFAHETGSAMDKDRVIPCITALLGFAVELDYILSDFSSIARRLSERAFSHLQRSIVADTTVRTRWINAFQNHETECEKNWGQFTYCSTAFGDSRFPAKVSGPISFLGK